MDAGDDDPEGASSEDEDIAGSAAAPASTSQQHGLKHSQSEPLESSTACSGGVAYSKLLIKAGWR